MASRAALAALTLAAWVGMPGGASAQSGSGRSWQDASWVDDLNFAGANALIAGLTGGLVRRVRGGSFSEGFTRGALGGGVVYLGKRTSAARFTAAGLIGRELGAVGSSITRSAAFGTGLLDTLVLPVGPARIYLPRGGAPGRWSVRLDLTETTGLIYALQESRLAFDLGRTLSSGVPVFTSPRLFRSSGEIADGVSASGYVALSYGEGPVDPRVLGHERVHVVQADFLNIAMGLPLEDWVARKVRVRALPVVRWVDFGQGVVPFHVLASAQVWGRSRSLMEVEADFLETR